MRGWLLRSFPFSSQKIAPFHTLPCLSILKCTYTVSLKILFFLPFLFTSSKQKPPELVHGQANDNVVKMAPEGVAAGHGAAPQGGPIHVEAPAPVDKKDHPPEQQVAPGPPQNQAKQTVPEPVKLDNV